MAPWPDRCLASFLVPDHNRGVTMATKPTIPQPLFPGDRATAPMALEDESETTWKQFEDLLSSKDMGFDRGLSAPVPAEPEAPAESDEETRRETVPTYEATQAMPMAQRQQAPAAPPAATSARAIEVNDVMTLARRTNRACPMPPQWVAFHQLLPVREQQGRRLPPPPPIEGTAWSASSPMQKRLRLRDQIEWADRTGALLAAYDFLAALPEEQWHHFG